MNKVGTTTYDANLRMVYSMRSILVDATMTKESVGF